MKNDLYILFIFYLSFSCVRENDLSNKVPISIIIDDKEIKSSEYDDKFKVRYNTDFSSDTSETITENGYLYLPRYDSSITYFELSYGDYKTVFTGELLNNELPKLISDSLTFWELRIDTPPFENENIRIRNRDKIKALGMLKFDFGEWTWWQF